MNFLAPLVFSAFLGLVTGIGHGFVSHYNDLPFSLTEQVFNSLSISSEIEE